MHVQKCAKCLEPSFSGSTCVALHCIVGMHDLEVLHAVKRDSHFSAASLYLCYPVSHLLLLVFIVLSPYSLQGRIQGGGGGMGGPCPTEQALNAEVYCTLRACSYSGPSAHLYMNHCFMSCKHESAAPLDTSVAVSHIQRLIPKGKWFPPCDESPELQSSCQTFCMVMVVSDGLRSTLISSKFI